MELLWDDKADKLAASLFKFSSDCTANAFTLLGGARPPARAPGRNATPYQVLTLELRVILLLV